MRCSCWAGSAMRIESFSLIDSLSPLKVDRQASGRQNESMVNDPLTQSLHLVSSQVLVIQPFKPLAQFLAADAVGNICGQLGVLQDVIFDEDRAIHSQSQCQRVRGPRIDADNAPLPLQPDYGVKSVLPQLGHDYFVNLRVQSSQDVLNQVVSHGPGRGDFLDLESDGVGLVNPDPNR